HLDDQRTLLAGTDFDPPPPRGGWRGGPFVHADPGRFSRSPASCGRGAGTRRLRRRRRFLDTHQGVTGNVQHIAFFPFSQPRPEFADAAIFIVGHDPTVRHVATGTDQRQSEQPFLGEPHVARNMTLEPAFPVGRPFARQVQATMQRANSALRHATPPPPAERSVRTSCAPAVSIAPPPPTAHAPAVQHGRIAANTVADTPSTAADSRAPPPRSLPHPSTTTLPPGDPTATSLPLLLTLVLQQNPPDSIILDESITVELWQMSMRQAAS